jgi:hypothetical protein
VKKKIVIIILSILLFTGVVGTFWGTSVAQAASSIWNSCPKGKVNCAYPGDCRAYIDTNNDRICDRSQSAPQTTTQTTTLSSSAPVDSSITGASGGFISTNDSNVIAVDTNLPIDTEGSDASGSGSSYYFFPIFITLVVLYSLTWILSAKKIFKTLTHRKIWNVVLLVSSLVSALLGIILILNIDFNTNIVLPFNTLFWHVEAGLALSFVAIFHIAWHWRYFSKLIALNKTELKQSEKCRVKMESITRL